MTKQKPQGDSPESRPSAEATGGAVPPGTLPHAVQTAIKALVWPCSSIDCERIAEIAVRETVMECAAICECIATSTEPEDFALDTANQCAHDIRARFDVKE